MVYIEYLTPQRVADPNYTRYDSKGGEYKPTWLIRTSDWKKVPGHEATDGYHTLSYVWEQSGEKILQENGEYDLKDNGRHQLLVTGTSDHHAKEVTVTYYLVTYDELLRQICHEFNIEYLWYDKTCIDQTNKEEKQREVKQMHLIYSNARYTVALVPEINIDDSQDFDRINWYTRSTEAKRTAIDQMKESLWWKRSWTLEEVMMSTQILIVGRNTHFWSLAVIKQDKIMEDDTMSNSMLGFKERKLKSANQVLHYAHFRTSTKEHDKIYALANILNGIADIDVDYSSDISTTANSFYRHLAKKDLSIMCFGANLDPDTGKPRSATIMDSHNLPSWTGISGIHSDRAIRDIVLDQNCDYTVDDNMRLHIKCRSCTIRPIKYNDDDIFEDEERMKEAEVNYFEVITSMDDFGDENEALDWSQYCMLRATRSYATHYHKPDDHVPFLSPILPLSLTELCDECVILGVVFDSVASVRAADGALGGYGHQYLSPVARKSTEDGFSYKIIGVILLKDFEYNEPRKSPQDVLDNVFTDLGCETHYFCIE